jgi:mannose-6-phosphate isomerase
MKPYPLQFRPILKQTIWGGRRLGEQLGKPIGGAADYAESWEVVDHGDDQSVVENGPLAGQTLASLVANHGPWLLGGLRGELPRGPAGATRFPLLLKYLDCQRVLSVQVHPADAYAVRMEKPDLGKTEAWYIVAADPGSLIYAGLLPGVDRHSLELAIRAGEIDQVLHRFKPAPGDVVFLPSGTVHALGAGLLVAEIQQSSDTTFRLFDWNRLGADGKPRPLHLSQGLDVADYKSGPLLPRHCDRSLAGWQTIVSCEQFVLDVIERGQGVLAGDGRFHILTVPRGTLTLRSAEGVTVLRAGATVLLPSSMPRCEVAIAADSTGLAMRLPA